MSFLKIFQEKHKLASDGVLGKNTIGAFAKEYNLTKMQALHILVQCSVETGDFKNDFENLNYNAELLRKYFRKYFHDSEYLRFARKPVQIANRVYANRNGNGSESTGDGWLYRGRGSLQVTFKNNYEAYFKWCGLPKTSDPDLLITPDHYFRCAVWFFTANGLMVLTDRKTPQACTMISRGVNRGDINSPYPANHEQDRVTLFSNLVRVI